MNPTVMTLAPLLHLVAILGAPSAPRHPAPHAPVALNSTALNFATLNSSALNSSSPSSSVLGLESQEGESQPTKIDASIWRYETGRRMRAMERAWATSDEPGREAAVKTVEKSVAFFFRANMAGVARELDAARRLLEAAGPPTTELERAGDAFAMVPSQRLVAAGTERLEVRVAPIYGSWDILEDALVTLRYSDLVTGEEYSVEHPCGTGGAELTLDLAGHSASLFAVSGTLELGDATVSIGTLRFEIVANLEDRLASLKSEVGRRSKLPRTIAARTASQYLGLLEDMASGKTPETNYSARELLERAELLALAIADPERAAQPDSGSQTAAEWIASPGERWLAVPIGTGAVNVRVFVPSGIDPGARAPLVVALHGAGGSHNMFFDGYGDGLAVDLARARGWILVAPQVGLFGCPVVELIDAISAHLPVDPGLVFVLGHSMGAGATIRAASGAPDRFLAISALGGGGRAAEGVASIPTFLGAGASDFGKGGVDALAARLRGWGATDLVHRTYKNTEHLLIVQRALPDVYAFFDAHLSLDAEPGR